ncbi:hypothetical protein [Actinoplanes flavus]|uniref:hypothetical protein n=1 Tax=Actinoplanes flavus TaxID=2820290 RepID=UPI0027DE28F5|nr:hypothetical protein [Actinoplanes flavus]
MPQRRRTAVTTALIAGLAVAAAGCDGIEIEVPAGSLPAPVSIAPVPSASAGQPKYVCSTVYKILTEGAVRLAEHTANDDAAGLQRTFADMASQVTTAGERSSDPAQRAATGEIAAALTEGSRQTDPEAFLTGEFATIGRRLDGTCLE